MKITYHHVLSENKKDESQKLVENILRDYALIKMIESKEDELFLIDVYKHKGRINFFRMRHKLKQVRETYKFPECKYPKFNEVKE